MKPGLPTFPMVSSLHGAGLESLTPCLGSAHGGPIMTPIQAGFLPYQVPLDVCSQHDKNLQSTGSSGLGLGPGGLHF